MEEALKELVDFSSDEMDAALDHFKKELGGIRAGKASPALLDGVKVDFYGSMMPINAVGTINAPDPRMLTVQVWDKSMVAAVDKAIRSANMGLNPQMEGQLLRIPLPVLTEERRRDLVKLCHQVGERAKVSVRNARRDANDEIKKTVKANSFSEDNRFEAEDVVQKLTDKHIAHIDELLKKKEDEILKV